MTISKETIGLIEAFKTPLINYLKDIKDEVKFYFDDGIINYIDKMRSKFSKTKTFLFRTENVNFYDIYFPVSLSKKKKHTILVNDINDLFSDSNYVTIIGNAGSGKSMLMKHIFLSAIKGIIKIPIVIELRNLNDFKGSLNEYIISILSTKKLTPNGKILGRIFEKGDFLFLLDGYDEVYSENKNQLTNEIIDLVDTYEKNYFLITSRPGANAEVLPQFENYIVNQLDNKQILEFCKLQLKNCEDTNLIKKITDVINRPENADYRTYLTSPLLLSMFILTFNSYPELPKSKSKFYWNVFDTLCVKHDAFTKFGGFQHERKTKLQNEEVENALKWFSYTSLFNGKYNFDSQYLTENLKKIIEKLSLKCNTQDLIYDLTVSISIILIDGLEYKFPHKSLQEYFTATLIKDQSEDNKKIIYTDKFHRLENRVFGGNESLYNLCIELDKRNFIKFFLLDQLQGFIEQIKFESEEKICASFCKHLGLHQSFKKKPSSDKYEFNSFGWFGTKGINIFSYLGIPSIHSLVIYNLNKEATKHMEILLKNKYLTVEKNEKTDENKYEINYSKRWDSKTFEFIKLLGLDKKILTIVQSIQKKIDDLIEEVKELDKNSSELLEI